MAKIVFSHGVAHVITLDFSSCNSVDFWKNAFYAENYKIWVMDLERINFKPIFSSP